VAQSDLGEVCLLLKKGVLPMKSLKSSLLGALALASLMSMPAFAKDGNDAIQEAMLLPAKGLSLASGLTVGTAIAIVRKSADNSVSATTSLVGDGKDFVPAWMAASVFGIPAGIVSGTVEGTQIGVKNAIASVDNPFSLDSLSLGDLK